MFYSNYLNFLHPNIKKLIHSFYYRSRYLIIYILIGIISIIFELQIRSFLIKFNVNEFQSSIFSLPISITTAFLLNIKFNFKIQRKKIKESFFYFFLISTLSLIIQFVLKSNFNLTNNYDLDRMIISGSCFIIFYFLHKKFSFKDYVKVGVAIYANGVEDINKIYNKIGPYPDFIHVDIVDKTFRKKVPIIKSYKLEIIKALWPSKIIQVHIMSKYPSKWIEIVKPYADKIFFHYEIDENIKEIVKKNSNIKTKLGLAVSVNTKFKDYKNFIKLFNNLLFLTIKEPGYSGQQFQEKSYSDIRKINNLTADRKFELCVDGGVNYFNTKNIKSDEIVSGSFILNSQKPVETLLKLKFDT
jgi:ribulose-phosphate 3-epimerase